MDDAGLTGHHLGYLRARREEGQRRPDLHTHTNTVYDRFIEVVKTNPEAYEREAGDMFAVLQAEGLDRHKNQKGLFTELGYADRAAYHERMGKAARESQGYHDIHHNTAAASDEASTLLYSDDDRRSALAELIQAILHYRMSIPSEKEGARSNLKESVRVLRALDDQLSWKRICTHRPYRACLPFTNTQLRIIGSWLKEGIGK